MSTVERTGVAEFRGRPVTLVGPEIRPGDVAPDFTVLTSDFSPVSLSSSKGTVRVFSVVPSLETPVCDLQTRRFDEEASALPGVTTFAVSVDLPFAQARWCAASNAGRVRAVSDHRDVSFGIAYGVLVKELRLLARAVFVVDRADRVVHAQYVPSLGDHPDYDAALAAAHTAV